MLQSFFKILTLKAIPSMCILQMPTKMIFISSQSFNLFSSNLLPITLQYSQFSCNTSRPVIGCFVGGGAYRGGGLQGGRSSSPA